LAAEPVAYWKSAPTPAAGVAAAEAKTDDATPAAAAAAAETKHGLGSGGSDGTDGGGDAVMTHEDDDDDFGFVHQLVEWGGDTTAMTAVAEVSRPLSSPYLAPI